MVYADIKVKDGSELKRAKLFGNKNLGDSKFTNVFDAEKAIENNELIYFGTKYIQGTLISEHIKEFNVYSDGKDGLKEIKTFVELNNTIYDTNDTAEFIYQNKDKLIRLLHSI